MVVVLNEVVVFNDNKVLNEVEDAVVDLVLDRFDFDFGNRIRGETHFSV